MREFDRKLVPQFLQKMRPEKCRRNITINCGFIIENQKCGTLFEVGTHCQAEILMKLR